MPDYLLLLQENPADFAHVTPEEMQRIVEAYGAWSDRLAADCPHLAYGRVLVREIDPLDGGAE